MAANGTRRTPPAKKSRGIAVKAPLATRTSASTGVPDIRTSWPPAVRNARNARVTGSITDSSMASMSSGGLSTFFLMSP